MADLAKSNASTGEVTIHRYLGDKLVALKRGSTVEYVHQDHLTGTALSTDTSGAEESTINYLPFGETRFISSGTGGSGGLGPPEKTTWAGPPCGLRYFVRSGWEGLKDPQ